MDIPYYRERGKWLAAHLRAGHEPPASAEPTEVVAFAEEVTGLRNARRILEIGCGWGRYSHVLAQRGYRIIATDVSEDLIALGQEIAMRQRRPIAFLDEALHTLDFPPYFDLVLCFESTLPLNVPSEPAARAALTGIAELLRPGGRFLLGSAARTSVPEPSETVYETPEGRAAERTRYDADTHMLSRTLRTPESERTHSTSYRHFSVEEIGTLLADAGFVVSRRWHGYDRDTVWKTEDRAGMIVLAQRAR